MVEIEYKSENGYSGKLYGKSSMSIYNPEGDLVLHTGSRKPQTLEELKDAVDTFPTFFEMLKKEEKIPCNTHFLKILPKWYEDVESGKKKFEIRRNDRPFAVGDILVLQEYWRGRYTGREIQKEIEYIYTGDGTYGLSDEFCILGIKDGKTIKR